MTIEPFYKGEKFIIPFNSFSILFPDSSTQQITIEDY
jgi:hypothetical protein